MGTPMGIAIVEDLGEMFESKTDCIARRAVQQRCLVTQRTSGMSFDYVAKCDDIVNLNQVQTASELIRSASPV